MTTYQFSHMVLTGETFEEIAETAWKMHLRRYTSEFQLIAARSDLPIQGCDKDDQTHVLRICADLPAPLKVGIPMEGTAWALFMRRDNDDWVVLSVVPLFSNKIGPEYIFGQRFSDDIVRRAA